MANNKTQKVHFVASGDPEGFGAKAEQQALRELALQPLVAASLEGVPDTVFVQVSKAIPELQWPDVLRLAQLHNVLYRIIRKWQNVVENGFDDCPPGAQIIHDYEVNAAVAGMLQRKHSDVLSMVAEKLAASVSSVAVLKSQVLAERYWRGQEERVSSDIDFLIKLSDMPAAVTAMEDLGYRPVAQRLNALSKWRYPDAKFLPPVDSPSFPMVEIHWLAAYGFGTRLDTNQLLDRAVVFTRPDQQKVWVLEPHDEFLMLSIHGAKHQFERMFWLYDLVLLLEKESLQPDLLWKRAKEASATNVLRYTLAQLEIQLNYDTRALLGGSSERKAAAPFVLKLERSILTKPLWGVQTKLLRMVFNLMLATSWRGKAHYLYERGAAAVSRFLP